MKHSFLSSRTLPWLLVPLFTAGMFTGSASAQLLPELVPFIPGSIEMISNGDGPITVFRGFESTLPPTSATGALSADWFRDVLMGPGSVLSGPPMQVGGGYFFVVSRPSIFFPQTHEGAVNNWLRSDPAQVELTRDNSYEIRFTAAGGKAIYAFTDDSVVDVPFELWFLANTPADPSDDVRMVPFLFDDLMGGPFDFKLDHAASSAFNDPYSDWIYFRMPTNDTPGDAGYQEFVLDPLGPIGQEHLARVVLMNWNQQQDGGLENAMPETGTTFRLAFANLFVVDIDIKPGVEPNEIVCGEKSPTPITVAVLSTEDFDATTVNGQTVQFAGAMEVHQQAHIKDVDSDGDDDVVLHFVTAVDCDATELILSGGTVGGGVIFGSDTILTIDPPVAKCDRGEVEGELLAIDANLHDRNPVTLGVSKEGGTGLFVLPGTFDIGSLDCNPYLFLGGPWIAGFGPGGLAASVTDFSFNFGGDFAPSVIGQTATPFRVFDSSIKEDKRDWPPEFRDSRGKAQIVPGAENLVVKYDDSSPRFSSRPPLGVEVKQRSLAFGGSSDAPTGIVFIWDVTNVSGDDLTDTYFGYWLDFDIGDASDDLTSTAMDMAVGWDSDFSEFFPEVPSVLGFAFLEVPDSDVIYSRHGFAFGAACAEPGSFDPFGGDHYNYLSGNDLFGGPISGCYPGGSLFPQDQRMVLSTPMNLAAGETARVAGALLFGSVPEGTTSLAVDFGTALVDPADPGLADLFSKRADVQALYDDLAAAGKLGKVGGAVADAEDVPREFTLRANYPNPFNPTTTVSYDLPKRADVTLAVYDVLGRQVRILDSGSKAAGTYEVTFDATGIPSGVYFFRLEAGDFEQTRRMVLVK